MNDIVKICKKHGQLTIDQTYNYGKGILCKPCHAARTVKWSQANKDKVNLKSKLWREKNPEKEKLNKHKNWYKHHEKNIQTSRAQYQKHIEKRRTYMVKKYRKNPNVQENYRLKRLFGITLDQYNEMVKSQNNLCAICEKPESLKDNKQFHVRKLAIDHCHKTGRIRGLLCFKCNIGLGKFNESIDLLRKAIEYLYV